MSKRVVVIASGETERRALPHLTGHLAERGVTVEDVRVPPGHRAITAAIAERFIRSVWFERADARPDKHLLGTRPYSSLVSEAIAAEFDAVTIAQRSPSFRGFVAAVENGPV